MKYLLFFNMADLSAKDLNSLHKDYLLLKINTWSLTLQNSNSPIYDIIIFFHDFTITILIFITLIIFFFIITIIKNNFINRFLLQNHLIEILWTIIPIIILISIGIPSLKILYITDENLNSKLSFKAIGHQWYWRYEYRDFYNVEFNSFIIPTNQLIPHEFRLLDTDHRCVLPYNYQIRILTTSIDVIHAWTIPALGIKIDSTPGRLNQAFLFIHRPGIFFGQCSEICGINHRFIPIVIESTNFIIFKNWLINFLNNKSLNDWKSIDFLNHPIIE